MNGIITTSTDQPDPRDRAAFYETHIKPHVITRQALEGQCMRASMAVSRLRCLVMFGPPAVKLLEHKPG